MASRDKFDVDMFHKSIQYALEKLGKSKSGFERTVVSKFKRKRRVGSGNELVDYSRAPCLGADQKARGLWERDCICCGLKKVVAKSRARVYFERQILALLLVFHQTDNLSCNKFARALANQPIGALHFFNPQQMFLKSLSLYIYISLRAIRHIRL